MTMTHPIILMCPKCNTTFLSRIVLSCGSQGVYSDLCPRYWGENPLPYFIHTCPNCYFTGTAEEFKEYLGRAEGLRLLRDGLSCEKYVLLAKRYEIEERGAYCVGITYHKGSWCARLSGERLLEEECLAKAEELLEKALGDGLVPGDQLPITLYIIGEISRLRGKFTKALKYYDEAASRGTRKLVALAAKQRKYAEKGDFQLKEVSLSLDS